jgi:hypothetical protein
MAVRALHQGVFGCSQGSLPLPGDRALPRILVPVNEAAEDQFDQGRVQLVEVRNTFGRSGV